MRYISRILTFLFFVCLSNTLFAQIPTITSFSPTSGPVGSAVTITGTNFSTTPANNIVWFGSVKATVNTATSTSLSVNVPVGATYQPLSITINGLTAYSAMPFTLTFSSSNIIDATSFSAKVDFSSGTGPFYSVIGDFDGDGKPDLAVTNYSSNSISVYRNTSTSGSIGAGSFAPKVDFATGTGAYFIAMGDLDGDGKPDLVVTNNSNNSISIFRNTATSGSITTSSFAPKVDFATGSTPYGVAIGDIDGDGKPDLAVSNNLSNTISVYRNTSTPGSITTASFAPKIDFSTGTYPYCVVINDIDGDRKPDIGVVNHESNSVSVFRNTCTLGSITTSSLAPKVDFSTGTYPIDLVSGDIDGDGKPDLAVANYSNSTVTVLRNISTPGSITSGSFATVADFITGSSPLGITMADMDGDSKPDLAVTNSGSGTISILKNNSILGTIGTGSFNSKVDFPIGSYPQGVTIGDLDGDGKPDLVTANNSSNSISVLRNTTSSSGLIAWYPFNGNANDASGNGLNGILNGVTLTKDRFGIQNKAFSFNGASNYIVTSASNPMDAFSQGSISIWFKTEPVIQNGTLFSYATDATSYSVFSIFIDQSKVRIALKFGGGGLEFNYISPTTLQPNTWYHFVLTVDGISPWKFYLNGNPEFPVFQNYSSATGVEFISQMEFVSSYNHHLGIGALIRGGGVESYFNGQIDDVHVYNRVLNSTEITSLYTENSWPLAAPVRDIDGNTYDTVKIGTQTWMKQNLKTTKYNDGTSIPNVTDGTFWESLSTPAFCWYNNDAITNKNLYGGLYNWYAVNTGKLCPTGWHVPTASEWSTLSQFLGGNSNSGGKLKEAGIVNWNTPNTSATNLSGFTALPGGVRNDIGEFWNINTYGYWWSSTLLTSTTANCSVLIYDNASLLSPGGGNRSGYSVRCLKDGSSSGLVASYPFNGNANDESGNENNGTIYGATPVDDRFGNANSAYNFDGSTSFIKIPHSPSLNPTSQITLSAWVNPSAFYPGVSYGNHIISKGWDQSVGHYGLLYLTDSKKFVFLIRFSDEPGTPSQIYSTTVINLSSWYNVVGTFDGSTMKIYINGVEEDQKTKVSSLSINSEDIYIGKHVNSSYPYYANGKIDDIKIYNKALSATEINLLYKASGWPQSAPVIDIDGNTYDTVKIGTQTWMKQNLKTTKYNDGVSIPNVTDNTTWRNLITPGYSWYNNDEATYKQVYGALYNWYAVSTGKVCPTGWHAPADSEWKTLEMHLGMSQAEADLIGDRGSHNESGKLKEAGTTHWLSPNLGADNRSGFSGLGGGYRYGIGDGTGNGSFYQLNHYGSWWTFDAYFRTLFSDWAVVEKNVDVGGNYKSYGFSLRCLKDDINNGLVAFYPFNGNANDESGNGYNGTVNGATLTTDRFGNANKAYNFSDNNFIDMGNILSDVFESNYYSISLWYNRSVDNNRALIHKWQNCCPNTGNNAFWTGPGGFTSNTIGSTVTSVGNVGHWTHWTATMNSGTLKMYVDGVLTLTENGHNSIASTMNLIVSSVMPYSFNGKIDDIIIYNRELASSEVDALYHENDWGLPPTITSFTPTSGSIGSTVTIFGTNFDPIPANNIVWFGATKASVITATETELVVTVPSGASYQPISVTTTLNGLTGYSKKPFNVTFPSSQIIDAASFSSPVTLTTASTPQYCAVSDIDGDGKPDLVYGGSAAASKVSIRRNTSTTGSLTTGSFAAGVDLSTGTDTNPIGISVADMDGDGLPDIIAANYNTNTVSVFRNKSSIGAISFDARVDFGVGVAPHIIEITDIDGDGKPDIAVECWNSASVSVLRNTSVVGSITSGSFASKVDFAVGSGPRGIASADFNGDNKPDLVVTNLSVNTISVLINTSVSGSITASSFAAPVDFPTSTTPVGVSAGDVDGDGKPDIMVSNAGSNSVSVIRNIFTSGTFTTSSMEAKVDYATGTYPMYVFLSDIDGDGKPDMNVVNPTSGSVSVLKNKTTTGTFTADSFGGKVDFPAGAGAYGLAVNDLDGDGKPDIFTVHNPSNTISILRNQITTPPPTITSFTPTYGPIGTSVTITGTNFSTTPANNIVWFGAVNATVNTATSTSLSVQVPSGATYQPVTVTVNGLTAYSAKPFIVTFSKSQILGVNAFNPKVDFPTNTGAKPENIALGDIDGDGKIDLVLVNGDLNTISIFRNTSTSGSIDAGSFSAPIDFATGLVPRGIAIDDLNGDGKLDIIVTNYEENSVSIFRNTSSPGSITSGSIAAKVDLPTGTGPIGVSVSDIDGDGKPEIVVINAFSLTVSIFRNKTTSDLMTYSSFAGKVDFGTGAFPFNVAIGDIDGDKKPDLAITSNGDNVVSILRNTSSIGSISTGSFSGKVDFPTGAGPMGIALGDLDGDDKPDLCITNQQSNMISILRNQCNAGSITLTSFDTKIDFTTIGQPMSVAIGDLDGDGKPDIAVSGGQRDIFLLKNACTIGTITALSFVNKVFLSGGNVPVCALIGDADGDGNPDIIVSNKWNNTISVLRNKITTPGAPTITSFTPLSGHVGASVTIYGTNFSTTLSDNNVWFGAVKATVTVATSSQIIVTVPNSVTYEPIVVSVNGLNAYSSAPFIVTFPSLNVIDGSSFASKFDFTTGSRPSNIAIGDIDNDGKPDAATANFLGNTVSIFRNTSTLGIIGLTTFNSKIDLPVGTRPYGVILKDLDGDNRQDLIAVNSGSNSISVFKNISSSGSITSGSFTPKLDFPTGLSPYSIAVGDIDSDGKPDIVIGNYLDNSVTILRNTTSIGSINSASFVSKIDIPVGVNPECVFIEDIDKDGKPDLAVTNNGSNTISIFRNTSASGIIDATSFAPLVDFPTGIAPEGVAFGDLDGDNRPDFVLANTNSNTISVFRNISTPGSIELGSFAPSVDYLTEAEPYYVAIGDIDGDSKPDLAVSSIGSNKVSVFKNNCSSGVINSESFSNKTDFTVGSGPLYVTFCDVDGDSKSDLLVPNYSSNNFSVLRNTMSLISAPTIGAITHPTCTVSTGSVVLTGLPATGIWTLTRSPGNVIATGSGTSTTISGLAAGTYTYTVTNSSSVTSGPSGDVVINPQLPTPSAPVIGTITHPTCSVATGTVILNGLPASGTWTLTRSPGGITTTGTGITSTITSLAAGTYSFTVTNSSSCVSVASSDVIINAQPATPSSPAIGAITHPTCAVATGTVVLNGLPASGTWTITRSPGGTITTGTGISTTISSLGAGTYQFTVTNASSCTSAQSADVVINPQANTPTAPTVGTIAQPTCSVATGSVELTDLPATGSWTLTRSPDGSTTTGSGTSITINGIVPGSYTYTVTSSATCISVQSASIVINAQPVTPSAPSIGTVTQPTCSIATGSMILNGLPATGSWTLTRSPGGTITTGSGATTNISGLAAGSYSYTVTNSAGCISASSSATTIAAQPVTPTAPVAGTITQPTCSVATGSVVMSGLPAGSWTLTRTPGGTTTGTTTTTTITDLAAGTYTFTVTNASSCTSAASSEITINSQPGTPPAPAVGTITQPTCATSTGSVVLSGIPTAGSWVITRSPGGTTTSVTGPTTTISGIPAGSYTFTINNAGTCMSLPSSVVVIDAQPVTPSAPAIGTITQPTCTLTTGSVVLSGLPATGTWSLTRSPGGTVTTGTGTTTTISGLTPGTYSFSLSIGTGCTSSSGNVIINNVPIGVIPVIVKKWNDVLICTNLNNKIDKYQWYKGTTPLTGETQEQFYWAKNQPGAYQVLTTDRDGCKNFSNIIQIGTGSKSLTAFPNPVRENVTIDLNDEPTGKAVISIFNEIGVKVLEFETEKEFENLLQQLSVETLDEGIYFVRVTIDKLNVYSTKIVIAK